MNAPNQTSIFAKIRNLFLIMGGMMVVFLGVSRFYSRSDLHQTTATPIDGIANAEVSSCGTGDAAGCGCGDDGGC